jgi:hypothetical protein
MPLPAHVCMQEIQGRSCVWHLHNGDVPTMTLDNLKAACWACMPPMRKRLVGRDVVGDFVQLAVENWEPDYLAACWDNDQRKVYASTLMGHMKRCHQATSPYDAQQYGFIWAFVLQAVAAAVIQWLVTWWLERNANRVLMAGWKQELTK